MNVQARPAFAAWSPHAAALICGALVCGLLPPVARGDGPGAAGGGQPPAAQLPAVIDIEQKVLAARRAIQSAEFLIDLTSHNARRQFNGRYHTWVAPGGRIRQELKTGDDLRVCIYDGESAFFYSKRPGTFDNPDRTTWPALSTWPAAEARRKEVPYIAIDPRVIMFTPVSYQISYGYELETVIRRPGRVNVAARPARFGAEPAVTVSFDDPRTGNSYEYDVAPTRGHNIVRWRMRGARKMNAGREAPFDYTVSCQLGEVADGVWFPETVTLTSTLDGQPYKHEVQKIQTLSVNQPIDGKTFTLGGGDLPANVVVAPTPPHSVELAERAKAAGERAQRKPAMIWDGQQLRELTREDGQAIQASRRR